jgi:hypothetical protein
MRKGKNMAVAIGVTIVASGIAIGLIVAEIWKLKRPRPKPLQPLSTQMADRLNVDEYGPRCACCNGYATELAVQPNGMRICRDRNLCRQTMIYKSMLDSV